MTFRDGADETKAELRVPDGTRAQADEWALVLASQGISVRVVPGTGGYVLTVLLTDRERAQDTLDAYRDENRHRPPSSHRPEETEPLAEPGLAGAWVALILVVCFGLANQPALHDLAYDRGTARADAILAGEWWRTVSALFLHADLAHMIGNALFGLYFVTAVARSLGTGLGLTLILAAGAIGNGLNAIGHPHGHDSLGASTAVFGAIGILSGMALARRNRSGLRGARLLLPVGAGLGLLAMLGTSGARVDLFAHVYGLLSGGLLGIAAKLGLPARPGTRTQILLGTLASGTVVLSFSLALRG